MLVTFKQLESDDGRRLRNVHMNRLHVDLFLGKCALVVMSVCSGASWTVCMVTLYECEMKNIEKE